MTSTDLATLPGVGAFSPTNWKELVLFADMMARSKSVPECYRGDPAAVIYAVQLGAELGLGPAQSLQNIANIDGKLAMYGDAPLAIIRRSGLLEWIQEANNFESPPGADPATWTEPPENQWWASCTMKRVGDDTPRTQVFTYSDAVRAGLWGRTSGQGKAMPWKTHPKRLMKYRARGFVSRDLFPDVLKGLTIGEEMENALGERNVTPKDGNGAGTGNEKLREKLAEQMGAAGVVKDKEPPIEGEVQEAVPDFSMMLAEQITETLEQAAMNRGMDPETYKKVAHDALKVEGSAKRRPLNRETAGDVYRAIRAWQQPEKPAETIPAEPAQATLIQE
jgi:hypothetical protein